MKKIYFICHYGEGNRKGAPSASTKIDYIVGALIQSGYKVEIISLCEENDRNRFYKKYNGFYLKKNGMNIRFFKTITSKHRIIRVIGRLFTWLEIKKYIRKNCIGNDCNIILYHSILLFKIYKLLDKYNCKYTIEAEEIYSDVLRKKSLREKEIEYMQNACNYIFCTQLLNNEVNRLNKPYVILHGTYNVENIKEKKNLEKNKIHCVYAGTFDQRKGGAIAAVEAAKYLPNNYHIHILGFGSEKEIENIEKEIKMINLKSHSIVTYDGLLTGDEYIKFIQSCDIGLSTQNPNAAFNSTSFPSKILSYMSNGLRVVSIKIPAIETSKIGKFVYYYEKQNSKEIANAIMKIDIKDNYDSRSIIRKLDKEFRESLNNLLN